MIQLSAKDIRGRAVGALPGILSAVLCVTFLAGCCGTKCVTRGPDHYVFFERDAAGAWVQLPPVEKFVVSVGDRVHYSVRDDAKLCFSSNVVFGVSEVDVKAGETTILRVEGRPAASSPLEGDWLARDGAFSVDVTQSTCLPTGREGGGLVGGGD